MKSEEPGQAKESGADASRQQDRIRRREERKQIQRKIERIEKEIAKLESEMKAADDVLNHPPMRASSPAPRHRAGIRSLN